MGHAEPKIDFGFLLIIPKKNWVFDRFFWVMHTFAQNWAMRLPKIFYSVLVLKRDYYNKETKMRKSRTTLIKKTLFGVCSSFEG